jgi:hypothetical protein
MTNMATFTQLWLWFPVFTTCILTLTESHILDLNLQQF